MTSWDYNCPQYFDFENLVETDIDHSDEYFDADHELPTDVAAFTEEKFAPEQIYSPSREMTKLQVPVNLQETLMAGKEMVTSSPSRKRHSYALRNASYRARNESGRAETCDPTAAKKPRTGSTSALNPLLLHKKRSQLQEELADRSLSLPRVSSKVESRKRHASETKKSTHRKENKTKKPGLTQVRPFHFATDDRLKASSSAKDGSKRKREEMQPYVSMAEQILAFQYQLPDRLKSSSSATNSQNASLKLTRPKTPRLRTNLRSRPVYAVSQEQKEEEELKEIQNYKFHARPFDSRILVHTIGIPMIRKRSPTRPMDVKLATDRRAGERKTNETRDEVFHFKAKPAPKKILGPMKATKPVVSLPPTEPKSPAFALKTRYIAWQKHQEELATKELEAAKNLASRRTRSGQTYAQSPYQKGTTRSEPFSFHDADKRRFAKKEEMIKKIIDQENQPHLFHANPMPSPAPSLLPKKPDLVITKPEPFQFLIDKRGQKMAEQRQQQIEDDMKKMKEAIQFKAQPCTVVFQEPFVPEKTVRPLTECSSVVLNTEKRAVERELYEEKRRQSEAEIEAAKLRMEAEQEEREYAEMLRMRAEATHKAQPAPKFQPPPLIKPSSKQLTKPQSPNFSARLRSARRDGHN